MSLHKGVTGGVALGLGGTDGDGPDAKQGFVVGAEVGLWIIPSLAIAARGSELFIRERSQWWTDGFLGPTVQVWPTSSLHVSLGLGWITHGEGCLFEEKCYRRGALDIGIGYSIGTSTDVNTIDPRNHFGVAIEVIRGSYPGGPATDTLTVVAGLLTYQYL